MRSRSRVRSLFVPLAIVGVLGAASVASAGTDTTTPEDTAAAGTEPAGTEAPAGSDAGRRRRRSRSRQRQLPAASKASTSPEPTVTVMGVETSEAEAGGMQAALDAFAEENGMTIIYTVSGTSKRRSERWWQAAPHPTSPCSRSQASRRLRPERRCVAAARRRPRLGERELERRLDELRQRRRHAVRRAGEVRPQVAGVVHPVGLRREGLRGADHARRLLRPHRGRWPPTATPRCASASSRARRRDGRSPTGWRSWSCATRESTTTTSGSPTRSRSTRRRSSRRSSRSATCGTARG